MDLSRRQGFYNELSVSCKNCDTTSTIPNSDCTEMSQTKSCNEVNVRMTTLTRSIGRGCGALDNFSLHMNSPPGLSMGAYRSIFKRLHVASKYVAEGSVLQAVEELKQAKGVANGEHLDCAASFDGTWQRRGHSSHHGVVTAISTDTGKCLDFEVLSNTCNGCRYWDKCDKTSREYIQWKARHDCKANHHGTANSMEAVGATRIVTRSELKYDIRYTQYLGDGDTSSFAKVCQLQPYGDTIIEKLECVGHVQKRVGTRLR